MMAGDRSDACTGVGAWKQHLQTFQSSFHKKELMQTNVRFLSRVTSGKDRSTFLDYFLTCSNRCKRRLDVALDRLSILGILNPGGPRMTAEIPESKAMRLRCMSCHVQILELFFGLNH